MCPASRYIYVLALVRNWLVSILTEPATIILQPAVATDSIEIKAVFFKAYNDQSNSKAIWVYQINTVEDSNFFYRMSWYADDFGDTSAVACVIGGGDKDTEFALRYQQLKPHDLTAPDPEDPYGEFTQVFGPSYSDGGQVLSAAYETITNPDNMYRFSDMPTALLTSPLNAGELISPWPDR